MTAIVPLKEGEVLVPIDGSAWQSRWKEIKLISCHWFKNTTYWWVEMTDKSGSTHIDTMNVGTLRTNWERKEKFYKVGKVYKFPNREDTWTVLDLYEVARPAYGNKVKAVARMDTPAGLSDIQTLSADDFRRMVRA